MLVVSLVGFDSPPCLARIVCDVENLGVDVSTCDSFRGNHLSGIKQCQDVVRLRLLLDSGVLVASAMLSFS